MNSQGYDECGCTTDTLRIDDPINLTPGSYESLLIPGENELGQIPCQAQTGDPINVTDGNMYIERHDVVLGSDLGLPIILSRHYNSWAFADSKAMGVGWRHSLEYDLSLDTASGNYTLTEASGRQILIKRHDLVQGATHQVRYDMFPSTPYRFAVDTSAGVSILTRQDDTRMYFRDTGQLDSLKDLSGNLTRLFYSNDRPDSIVNSSGRTLMFGYSGGALTNVRSSYGDTLAKYEYDASNGLLERTTYADGSFETYSYGDSAYDSDQVVAINTSDGLTRHYSYDTSGLANSYYRADGFEKVDLHWIPPQALPSCLPPLVPETTYCHVSIQNDLDSTLYGIVQPFIGSARQVVSRENADCGDCAIKYEYDENGMKKVVTYANGAVDSIWHDSRGNVIAVVVGANASVKQRYTWSFDSTFNSPLYEKWSSVAKTNDYAKLLFSYDAHGNATKLVETGWKDATHKYNDTSWYSYNAAGQTIKTDGPRRDVADTVQYVYYGNGDLRYEIQANGDTTEYGQRDELGHRTWVKSSAGDTTRFIFNVRGRMTGIILQAGTSDSVVQTFSYNVDGDLTSSTRSDGTGLTMHYSSAGYLDSIVDPQGSRYAYEYDSVGNAISEKIFAGDGVLRQQAEYTYDDRHQLTQIAGLYGDTVRFGYSPVGTVDTVWDGLSHRTVSRIDPLRRVIASIQPDSDDSIKIQYQYDVHDNVTKIIDPDTNEYVFKYDDKDNVVYDSCGVTGVTRYGYDAAGNLVWEKNAAGDSISYRYDALDRLTGILFPDSQNVRYFYDGAEYPYGKGRLYLDSTAACWVKYQYDSKGRLYREHRRFAQDTVTYTTSYHYDKGDNIDTVTYPTGRMVAYKYDSANNVVQVNLYSDGQWKTLADSIRYAPFGDAESWILGNGIKVSVGLDSSYRIDSVSTDPDTVARVMYTLDAADNITGITNGLDSLADRAFVYDDTYRLIEARSRDYLDTLQKYLYSRNGNRDTVIHYTDSTVDTSVYLYTNNRLTQVNGATDISFTYDALGNITRTIRGTDTTTFQYSDAGTLTGVDDGATASYSYDSRSRRIKKVVAGITVTKFIPDEEGRILTEYAVTGGWNRDYIYLNGQLLARVGSAAGEGIQYVVNDHLGTPMALVDSAKTIRWRAKWYPFGEVYDEFVSTDNDVRFPGQIRDDETGLYYNWHRYYSPQLGRYYQADQLGLRGGDYNVYRYANGSPLRYIDPYGLYSWGAFGYDAAQFAIGFGDAASFGRTKWIRSLSWYGGDCFTDTRSRWYQLGGYGSDIAWAFIPVPVGKFRFAEKLFQLHRHHMIPWEFRYLLPKGMNINDYMKVIPAWRHNLKPCGIHTGPNNYNKMWREFFYTTEDPTRGQIMEQMYKLERYFSLDKYRWLMP
jgi:RHS repeat-associated protein